ncbi:hypothetical protein GCM10022197_12190 [Microlunatus spumicola]|uniref:DhaL domain-containing protein n=1 Tax=Microlunatus spumicola TaxID=81499 RepID=A0ABP6WZ89_9ACTN
MTDPVLDGAFARSWFDAFRVTFATQADRLADLDRQAGDGDFGANLTSALTRAQGFVDGDEPRTYADVLLAVSKGFLATGGTSGPLFGMWFRDLARAADDSATVATLAAGVAGGLATIQRLAGAEVGDATMVDAIDPAAKALAGAAEAGSAVADALEAAATAARDGAISTRDLLAGRGRASYVGEVARGVLDPGAVAVALFFAAGAQAATGAERDPGWLDGPDAAEAESRPEPHAASDAAPPPVGQAALDDLHERLRRFREVPLPRGHGWERGVDAAFLRDLVRHWAETYDWRAHEEQVRAWPWVRSSGGEVPLRAVHQRSGRPGSPALLLLHGWPDSVLRFAKVLPLLGDVDVVVPALPGFPFAVPLDEPGVRPREMAAACAALMAELGHDRYVVSAGDVGSEVADWVAADHAAHVSALHLTDVSQNRYRVDPPTDLSEEERAYVARGHAWQEAEGGYSHEQATKPHTLAIGLGDSPAGTAAWIAEKLRSWTDSQGDVATVFTPDELLTWVSAYWFSGAIGTSFTAYVDGGPKPAERLRPPTAFTVFPHDLVNAPRSFAERFYDVRVWREEPSGGHFAAWERPEAFVRGVRDALALAEGT